MKNQKQVVVQAVLHVVVVVVNRRQFMTPMMEQYLSIKKKYEDCILFYRLGDFYEMFLTDAILASKELGITLTARDSGGSKNINDKKKIDMCGVPYHSADSYIAKLVKKGYKVAICEQIGDPKASKSIVKREVVRVITPGTILDNNSLDESKNNYIMCIFQNSKGYGVALADVTTGEFLTTSFFKDEERKVIDEIAKFNPAEIIVNEEFTSKDKIENIFNIDLNIYAPWCFEYISAYKKICNHFNVISLKGFGIDDNEHSIACSGALLQYLSETQMTKLKHISSIRKYNLDQFMFLDISSRRNLELCQTLRGNEKKGSLLWVLDKTKTSMGARLIRKWIEQPLINVNQINKRLDAVSDYKEDPFLREDIKDILEKIKDIERIMGRIVYATANGQDLIALKKSFENLPKIKAMLKCLKSSLNQEIHKELDCLEDVYNIIEDSINEETPISIRDGNIIKDGFNKELDMYREAKNKGTDWLLSIEEKERTNTGIKNLKIKYNKVFGYCIEVTNSYKDLVPDTYIRRQTLASAERYITPELKEIEDKILSANEKITEIEYSIFSDIRNKIADEIERIQDTANKIATIDVLQSLGDVAYKNSYVKPNVNNGGIIEIKDGRHPVVELLTSQAFIPNDIFLDKEDSRIYVITGPNMAGKSTYMRQCALITLMAQIGCFIPASSGTIGIVDRIFTRVGASDDLATGQSTFMVEMNEVANILNNATTNSLLILDEIGRGTSTYDGLSIAWSVLEYISDKQCIGAKTLFATHYHELTEIEGKVDGAVNYCVTVEEIGKDIVFLRKVVRGSVDKSYGIHVAQLAGIPKRVIDRSNEIMSSLLHIDIIKNDDGENSDIVYFGAKKPSHPNTKHNNIITELQNMDINALSAKDALSALSNLKQKLD